MIPSLGALIKETLPPSYQSLERIVYPGKDIFYFNPELRDRDNLLDNLYARNYGISLRRARLTVDRDVEELRGALSSLGTVNLGKLGAFQLDERGKLLFMPSDTEKYLGSGENYGLMPYSLPQLRKEKAITSSITPNNNHKKSASQKKHADSYLHFRIHKRIVSVAAVVVILLTILIPTTLSPVLNRYSAGFAKTEISDTKSVEKENLSSKKPLSPPQAEKVSTVEPTAPVAERTTPIAAQAAATVSNYYVVIGAFFSEEKAKTFIDGCQNSAFFPTTGYLKHGDRYMIYAYRAQSRNAATDFIRQLRETYQDKRDTWILHIAPQ